MTPSMKGHFCGFNFIKGEYCVCWMPVKFFLTFFTNVVFSYLISAKNIKTHTLIFFILVFLIVKTGEVNGNYIFNVSNMQICSTHARRMIQMYHEL